MQWQSEMLELGFHTALSLNDCHGLVTCMNSVDNTSLGSTLY